MPRQTIANTAAIATGHPLGANAGLEILREGGNAIDAAVAAMIALSVVIPGSVGLGGYGGCAVLRMSEATPKPVAGLSEAGRSTIATSGLRDTSHNIVAVDFDSCAPLEFR